MWDIVSDAVRYAVSDGKTVIAELLTTLADPGLACKGVEVKAEWCRLGLAFT